MTYELLNKDPAYDALVLFPGMEVFHDDPWEEYDRWENEPRIERIRSSRIREWN